MREILFRGKRVYNGEWIEGNLIVYPLGKVAIFGADQRNHKIVSCEVDPATVGQYTGLQDKNGKRIFEGDIVEFFGMRGTILQECGAFGIGTKKLINYNVLEKEIPFHNSPAFCYNDNFMSLWELWWNYEQDDNPLYELAVIGNIHDNPELLEVAP